MVALCVRVGHMRATHADHFLAHAVIRQQRRSQLGPVRGLATSNHIVDRGKRQSLVVQVAMEHRLSTLFCGCWI